jgi:hypothetical protein
LQLPTGVDLHLGHFCICRIASSYTRLHLCFAAADWGRFAPGSFLQLSTPANLIFYYEALCVLSALHHAANACDTPSKIVIYTDNSNTVDIFNSMRSLPAYNDILKSSVDIRLETDHQLRVLHVPGHNNTIADAISRLRLTDAIAIRPDLHIDYFQPPQLPLGAVKK